MIAFLVILLKIREGFLIEDKHFSNILQRLPYLHHCIIGDASFKNLICPDVFYRMIHPNEWASVFTDRVKELYPTDTDYLRDLRSFRIRCKVIPVIVFCSVCNFHASVMPDALLIRFND